MPVITSGRLGFFVAAPSQIGPPSPLLADNIDPETKDFRSLFVGADVVDAQVQLAMATARGSGASVQNDGIRITPRKITESFADEIKGDAKEALRRLIVQRDIALVDITFGADEADVLDGAGQTAQANIKYRNLRALQTRVITMQLPLSINVRAA